MSDYTDYLRDARDWFVVHEDARPPDSLEYDGSGQRQASWHMNKYALEDEETSQATRDLFAMLDERPLEWRVCPLGASYYIETDDHPVFAKVTIYMDAGDPLPSSRLELG